ncbi:hypothetical protein GCM10010116_27810 [Microbispora rosea subsp. aerata]|nr:hypothetical protein GCM10010116_27810 [Microbispora rosea subsp. aerata]
MSWLTGGPAMAKDGALADACRAHSRDVRGHDRTGGLTTLAPASGVLSIADAAGMAAGQGHKSLPSATRTIPGPAALPAVPGPRTLPSPVNSAVSGVAKTAPAVGGTALPTPANVKTLPAPVDAKTLPAPVDAKTLPAPVGAKTLPTDVKTISAPAQTVTAPVHTVVSGTKTIAEPRRVPALPAADAKTLFPSRSTVPLLAAAPAKPANPNACKPQALRTGPDAEKRERSAAEGHPKKNHRPRPEGAAEGPASRGDSAHGRAAHKPDSRKPGAQNQAPQDATAPSSTSNSSSYQSGASGQEQSTETFPVRDRRHRKHPHKQHGATAPGQAANQSANQAGQAGRPKAGMQNSSLPEGERKKGAKDKRRRHDGERGRGIAPAVQPDAADGKHVPRLLPREYPAAATRRPNGDITAPAVLSRATDTRAVTDLAASTGKKLLP